MNCTVCKTMEVDQENMDTKSPESYCKHLMVQMNECRTVKSLCDVNLVVEGIEFPAHRIVLAVGSPFFHGLFTSEMKEKQENKIVLKAIKASVMENILEYLYTGKTEVNDDNAHDLMSSASYFLMDNLKEVASSCICETLDLENCLKTREFAEKYDCMSLEKKCKEFIKDHFHRIIEIEEFFDLELEKVEEFFFSEETFVFREEVMYEAIKKWVKKSPATRKKHFKTLFRHVRLQQISRQYVKSFILKDGLVTADPTCMQFVLQSMSTVDSLPLHLKPRQCFDDYADVIVISGGFDADNTPTTSVLCLTYLAEKNKKWQVMSPLSTARYGSSSAYCGGFLYCVGGWECNDSIDGDGDDIPVKAVERYDPVTNSWLKVRSTLQAEKWITTASLDGYLYVLGRSNQLYCYTPSLDIWHSSKSFQGEIHGACFVADSSSLYIIGGLDENNLVTSACARYDPEYGKCSTLRPIHVQRYLASAVYNRDHIYVAGGLKDYESTNALGCCEVYSIKDDQWEMLFNLQYPRYSAGIACVWDDIYILGGEHEGETQNTVEHYNERNQRWEVVSSMPGRSYFSCNWVRIPWHVLNERESISLPS